MTSNKHIHIPLENVFDMYGDMLFRIALTHTANREDAEDACQDVFVKYAQYNQSFKDQEHIKSWLIRVCINRCHDLERRRRIRSHLDIYDMPDLIAEESIAHDYIHLTDALSKLPVKYKDVIILHYYEDLSVEECSHALNISISAVKMRLMRARDLTKEILTKEE